MINASSMLVLNDSNPCEKVNRIPAKLLQQGFAPFEVGIPLWAVDAVVAHGALFDRDFMRQTGFEEQTEAERNLPWICTLEDFQWPEEGFSRRLVDLALAHGVTVTASHRALHDCLLIAESFQRIPDIDERLARALEHAKLPRVWLMADIPFERKDEAKEHRFAWFPGMKQWRRHMAIEDAKTLPFPTRICAP